MAALRRVPGLSQVSDGEPIQSADAYAVVEIGPETDWGHKSGEGAEVRIAVRIGCGGEQPGRVRGLIERARQSVAGIGPALGQSGGAGWRLVSLAMVRSRAIRTAGPGWAGSVEYRARLLRE
jgi:hypothetical protein